MVMTTPGCFVQIVKAGKAIRVRMRTPMGLHDFTVEGTLEDAVAAATQLARFWVLSRNADGKWVLATPLETIALPTPPSAGVEQAIVDAPASSGGWTITEGGAWRSAVA